MYRNELDIEAEDFRTYVLSFIAAGQNDEAWFLFFRELIDTMLSLAAEGYDLTFSSYFQDLLEIGRECFGYEGESLVEELYGGEEF